MLQRSRNQVRRIIFPKPIMVASGEYGLNKSRQGDKIKLAPILSCNNEKLFRYLCKRMLTLYYLHHYQSVGSFKFGKSPENGIQFRSETSQIVIGKLADYFIEPDHLRPNNLRQERNIRGECHALPQKKAEQRGRRLVVQACGYGND